MSCQKASYIIEKRELTKLSLWEKISLKFHLMICSLCRRYESDSKVLGKILKSLHNHSSHASLSAAEKEAIKQKLAESKF